MSRTGKRFEAFAILMGCLLTGLLLPAAAQNYPNRAIRVVVPVGPGGGYDLLARIVSPGLSDRLGQPVVVENRPGAGSLVGTEVVAKAPHDGYTLLVGGLSNIAANAGLYKTLPYDPLEDFRLLSLSVTYSLCLVSRKDLPHSTLKEVIGFARANPGKLTYASAGVGSAQHVAAALLAQQTNTNMLHIPYKGAGAAQQDMLAGRVDIFFNNCGAVKPFIDSGQMKVLAVTGRERSSALPQVPTILETGVANLEMDSWIGFFIGAKTPPPVIEKLRAEIASVLSSPEIAARLEKDGGKILLIPMNQAEAYVASEVNRWRMLIPQAGVSVE
jgi:tripartite-type tricarboxylate transporter receptor subunit TctC